MPLTEYGVHVGPEPDLPTDWLGTFVPLAVSGSCCWRLRTITVRDIHQPRGLTNFGLVTSAGWYRQVSRPGRLPLDAISAPTPSEVTARGRQLDAEAQQAKATQRQGAVGHTPWLPLGDPRIVSADCLTRSPARPNPRRRSSGRGRHPTEPRPRRSTVPAARRPTSRLD
jgi:hypothetical protein